MSSTRLSAAMVCLVLMGTCRAEDTDDFDPHPIWRSIEHTVEDTAKDAGDYATAPLHWNRSDWLFLGGAIAATTAAHAADRSVRKHFTGSQLASSSSDPHSLKDAMPALAALAGTAVYAGIADDRWGRRESWSMLEAAGFGAV